MIREKMGYDEFKNKETIDKLHKTIREILKILDDENHKKALKIVLKYNK